MNVKVLGSGCEKCKLLYAEVEKAIAQVDPAVELEKVEKIAEIVKYGVMNTPALVLDGEVKCSGRIPTVPEIVSWLKAAGAKQG